MVRYATRNCMRTVLIAVERNKHAGNYFELIKNVFATFLTTAIIFMAETAELTIYFPLAVAPARWLAVILSTLDKLVRKHGDCRKKP